jgi:hypothetical protein
MPNAPQMKEFHDLFRDYPPGYATSCRYQYTIDESGQTIEMTFNGTSFICRIPGSASYFVGDVRGNASYIFDHASASAVNFRISGCRRERDNVRKVSRADWLGN